MNRRWVFKTPVGIMGARRLHRLGLISIVAYALMGSPHVVHAQNDLMGGVGDIVGGALSLPYGLVAGTLGGPPILGTINGALRGALNTISLTTRGIFRLLGVALPLAGKAATIVPIFL